jgi:hypothetical protein
LDVFTIYHVEPLLGVGMPLLVTAITEDTQKQWAGEMYLLLQDPECTVLQIVVRVDGNAWPLCEVKLSENFIEEELLQQAHWRLGLYRQERGHVEKYGLLSRPVQMNKTNLNSLAAFWMQSKCGDKFIAIQTQTKSASLREKLALVISLPKFRYEAPI